MGIKNIFKKQKDQKEPDKDKQASVSAPAKPVKKPRPQVQTEATPKHDRKSSTSIFHQVLIKPLNTEKGAKQTEQRKYLFMVSTSADKISIAKAVEETYGVKVAKVNTLRYTGKNVRYGRKEGKRKNWKKAVVTLRDGESIEVYKGV